MLKNKNISDIIVIIKNQYIMVNTIFEILDNADNDFVCYMIFFCAAFVIIGGILGIWVYGLEWLLEKFNLKDKLMKFLEEPENE